MPMRHNERTSRKTFASVSYTITLDEKLLSTDIQSAAPRGVLFTAEEGRGSHCLQRFEVSTGLSVDAKEGLLIPG